MKDQNACWYKTGSPPPLLSKNVVLKLIPVKSMVMLSVKTGKESKSKKVVIKIDQVNVVNLGNEIRSGVMPLIVQRKFMAPKIEAAPETCRLKITSLKASLFTDPIKRISESGSNQKLTLFILGKAMSGAPIIRGANQLPNPPIKAGITTKKIIMEAWLVIITLYKWLFPFNNAELGLKSACLIYKESVMLARPEKPAKIKYNSPISLWLQEKADILSRLLGKVSRDSLEKQKYDSNMLSQISLIIYVALYTMHANLVFFKMFLPYIITHTIFVLLSILKNK